MTHGAHDLSDNDSQFHVHLSLYFSSLNTAGYGFQVKKSPAI
ncbi:hypothetical protein [Morganella morganii IS15]|nr:hypothetical protein [Morganella morganii IS15]